MLFLYWFQHKSELILHDQKWQEHAIMHSSLRAANASLMASVYPSPRGRQYDDCGWACHLVITNSFNFAAAFPANPPEPLVLPPVTGTCLHRHQDVILPQPLWPPTYWKSPNVPILLCLCVAKLLVNHL